MKLFRYCLSISILIICSCRTNSDSDFHIEEEHKFGTVKVGDNVKVNFVAINNSDSVIMIKDIITDCGCITNYENSISDHPINIEPNSRDTLSFTYTPTLEDIGYVKKVISLRTNSLPRFKVLSISGEVKE